MRVRAHTHARAFLLRAGAWLAAAEVENGTVFGLARSASGTEPKSESPVFLVTVERDGEVVGCAARRPPFPLALTSFPVESIEPLVDLVHDGCGSLPGVIGPPLEATRFAEAWTARFVEGFSTRFELRIHALSEVVFPDPGPPGRLRRASESDLALTDRWHDGFVQDARIDGSPGFGRWAIREGRLYFWDDGEPRCMVASTRETPNVSWINAVYTPPRFRGRGYGTAAVAAVSQRLLERGRKFCALYTDLANPVSNEIYRRVGYEPVRDDVELSFSAGAGEPERR